MVGAIIRALLYLCALAIVFYLVVWVLENLGIALPAMVIHIIGVMFVLFAILVLWNLFAGRIGSFDWWGRGPTACFLIAAALSLVGQICSPARAEHGGWGHWGGAEFSGRGIQNEHHEGRRHERHGHHHEDRGEGRWHNDRWYGPEWCWTENGIPFRCD